MCTGKNNRFPFLDILGYLKNTHKSPKFGKVRDKSQPGNSQPSSLIGTCLTLPNFGFLWVFFKYPKISKNGNQLFFPVVTIRQAETLCQWQLTQANIFQKLETIFLQTQNDLLSAATIETTMEVVVDELWTRTVAKMPIIRPATGLLRMSFEAKASPAAFPPNRRKALLRKSNEQMNKYRKPRSRTIFANDKATRRNFPNLSSSVVEQTERFGHSIISPVGGQGEGPGGAAPLSKGLDDRPQPPSPVIWCDRGYTLTLLHRHCKENIILVCIMYLLLFSVRNTDILLVETSFLLKL